jgi:hypothetical protein
MSISKRQKHWDSSAAERAWLMDQLKDLDLGDWGKEEENG